MKYSEGHTGRVIVARFSDGEEFVSGMKELVLTTKITSALVFFIGALRSGEVVVGPVEDVIPPTPEWMSFEGAWEVVGIGTLFSSGSEPLLHMHGAIGRDAKSLVGCIRKIAEVYLIMEVVLLEICDTGTVKVYDPVSGHFLLDPNPDKP